METATRGEMKQMETRRIVKLRNDMESEWNVNIVWKEKKHEAKKLQWNYMKLAALWNWDTI